MAFSESVMGRLKKRLIVITGHYGAGKTNIAVNLALSLASSGRRTALVDLDIVNPYFRAADSRRILDEAGVRCILPEFANSNVDIPSLPAEIFSVFQDDGLTCVFDVGGDDDGATALGMFAPQIQSVGYEMLYVISSFRPLIADPEDAAALMRDIEAHARLTCTGLINNSNLGAESDTDGFADSFSYADAVASLTGLPLLCDTTCLDGFPVRAYPDRTVCPITDHTKKLYGG